MSWETWKVGFGPVRLAVAVCWYGLAIWLVLEYVARILVPGWDDGGGGVAGWAARVRGVLGLLVLGLAFVLLHWAWTRALGTGVTPGAVEQTPAEKVRFPAPVTLQTGVAVLSCAILSLAGVVALLVIGATSDVRQAVLMTLSAGLGSSIATILGYLKHASEDRDFDPAYAPWYVARPLIGLLLGLLFFFVVKGGILVVLPTLDEAKDTLNAYGLAAIGGMVGLFSKNAVEKLREVFNVLFQTREQSYQELLARMPADLQALVRPYLTVPPGRGPAPTPPDDARDV